MYHFVSGFTAKLAGTEVGVTEPQAAFSACFGAPFMAHKPIGLRQAPAREDGEAQGALHPAQHRLERRAVRRRQAHLDQGHARAARTRRCAAISTTGKVEYETHPIFNLRMPTSLPRRADAKILNPRNTWTDKAAYDAAATKLRDMFRKNFEEKGFAKLGIEPVM